MSDFRRRKQQSGTIPRLRSSPLLHGSADFMDLTLTSSLSTSSCLPPEDWDTTCASIFWIRLSSASTRSMPSIWPLLIPYFIVLIILAAYGGHRYWMVYLYYKHKKNKTTEPPAHFDNLPRVTVQLPIYNEQYVVDRLLDAVCRLDYPKTNSTSSCSTIRPTRPWKLRASWSIATPPSDIPSSISTATTARAIKLAL